MIKGVHVLEQATTTTTIARHKSVELRQHALARVTRTWVIWSAAATSETNIAHHRSHRGHCLLLLLWRWWWLLLLVVVKMMLLLMKMLLLWWRLLLLLLISKRRMVTSVVVGGEAAQLGEQVYGVVVHLLRRVQVQKILEHVHTFRHLDSLDDC